MEVQLRAEILGLSSRNFSDLLGSHLPLNSAASLAVQALLSQPQVPLPSPGSPSPHTDT